MKDAPNKRNCEIITPGAAPLGTAVPGGTASPCHIAGRLVVLGGLVHGRAP